MKRTKLLFALLLCMVVSYIPARAGAGPNQTICVNATTTITFVGTMSWSSLWNQNIGPASTNIASPLAHTTMVTGFTLPGLYSFTYGSGGPGDTTYITVLSVPSRPGLTQRGTCADTDTLMAHGAGAADTIQWWANGLIVHISVGYDSVYVPMVPGSYSVRIANAGNCISRYSDTVAVAECPPDAGPDQRLCMYQGSTAQLYSSPVSGVWRALAANPGSSDISDSTYQYATVGHFAVPGVYGYSWGTNLRDTVYVTAMPMPAAPVLEVRGFCLGNDTLIAHVYGAAAGDSLSWNVNYFGSFNTSLSDSILIPTQSCPYSCVVLIDTNHCYSYASDSISIDSCRSASGTAGPDQTTCQDSYYQVQMYATTTVGVWRALPGNPSPVMISDTTYQYAYISGLSVAGVYGFTWGIGTLDTMYITVLPRPVTPTLELRGHGLGSDTLIAHLYGVQPGDSLIWNVAFTSIGTSIYDTIYLPTAAGPYNYVQVIGANGCYSYNSDTFAISPGCTLRDSTTKDYFTNSVLYTAWPVGGTPPYSYLWNTGSIDSTTLADSTGAYCVTITDAMGCQASHCDTIVINNSPCNLYTASFSYIIVGRNTYYFQATNNAFSTSDAEWVVDGVVVSPYYACMCYSDSTLMHGTHTVCAIVTNGSCVDTVCQTITVNPSHCHLSGSISTQIYGGAAHMTATVTGGSGIYTYDWSSNIPINYSQGNMASIGNNGIYYVTVTDTNGCYIVLADTITTLSCDLHDTIVYSYLGAGQYHFEAHVTGSTAPLYKWSVFNLNIVGHADTLNYTLPVGQQYMVLWVHDSITGCYNSDSIIINVPSGCHLRDSVSYYALGGGQYEFEVNLSGAVNPGYYWYTSWAAPVYTTPHAVYTIPIGQSVDVIAVIHDSATGCYTADTISIFISGIHDPLAVAALSLYPNPNSGLFILRSADMQGREYTVSDMLGRVVAKSAIVSDHQAIDLRHLAEGSYILTIRGNPDKAVRFVIKPE